MGAYQNLDPLTFDVLNQTKTLSAALCCYFIIGKKQSTLQAFSLLLLLLSALIIEKIITLDMIVTTNFNFQYNNTHVTYGVVPVVLASFISGLAGALTQRNLQKGRNSVFFSMELCVASILFLSLTFIRDPVKIDTHTWTKETFIPIFVNAIGGILVGLVTKYAGSVRKGFALIFGLLISGLVQLETQGVSKEQIIGGILAAISLYLHSNFPYKQIKLQPINGQEKKKKKKSVKEE